MITPVNKLKDEVLIEYLLDLEKFQYIRKCVGWDENLENSITEVKGYIKERWDELDNSEEKEDKV